MLAAILCKFLHFPGRREEISGGARIDALLSIRHDLHRRERYSQPAETPSPPGTLRNAIDFEDPRPLGDPQRPEGSRVSPARRRKSQELKISSMPKSLFAKLPDRDRA
ncbi:uncharacterized protein LOC112341458 isoform X1 [Selaginella moellendorffii]|uniref:uncharacterized protein LOC112341458 isoform X1 n=1 Tax=Selaginella moellendorffii TaxID=88036 RepID=UPI000D1C996C|nr:uncharacterized protein LOC112341458 isoform X1 [Selaginella moellendorffii]|eukprot:XP_024517341.1 uncharacterized protein LOC112341458 isoform X1 [Selaginella moellendorffii]